MCANGLCIYSRPCVDTSFWHFQRFDFVFSFCLRSRSAHHPGVATYPASPHRRWSLRRYATRSQKGLFIARGVWPRSRHPPAYQSVCTWPACHHSPTATVDRLQQLTGRRYNSEQATSHGQKDQRLIVPGGLAIAHPSSSRLLSCTYFAPTPSTPSRPSSHLSSLHLGCPIKFVADDH